METKTDSVSEQIEGHPAPKPMLTVEKASPAQHSPGPPVASAQSTPVHVPHGSSAGDEAAEATGCAEPAEHSSAEHSAAIVPATATESDQITRKDKRALEAQFAKHPFKLCRTRDGTAYAVFNAGRKNAKAMLMEGNPFYAYLANSSYEQHGELNAYKLREDIQQLTLYASHYGELIEVWIRVAPIAGGIEIALNDDADTRLRVTDKGVEKVHQGSDTAFSKSPISQALPIPSDTPDLSCLDDFLNVDDKLKPLIWAWVTYSLCAPKCEGSKYVFLVVQGEQGSGKSFLCRVLQRLLDPSSLGLQAFPSNAKDLSIILSQCHLVVFDNVRSFSASISDLLCTAATGGNISSRALYSNDTLHVLRLHGAIIFNSIHGFVVQSDLAQRCLTVRTNTIEGATRIPESQLLEQFERDLPHIFAGLLELSSRIMAQLPHAQVKHSERMIEFCRWIAAMELALDLPSGSVQAEYSNILNESQLETLLENQLASEIISLMTSRDGNSWTGTPSELLELLENRMTLRAASGPGWPRNAIALSKRLNALKASLATQGIRVALSRGKRRQIDISVHGDLETSTNLSR